MALKSAPPDPSQVAVNCMQIPSTQHLLRVSFSGSTTLKASNHAISLGITRDQQCCTALLCWSPCCAGSSCSTNTANIRFLLPVQTARVRPYMFSCCVTKKQWLSFQISTFNIAQICLVIAQKKKKKITPHFVVSGC